MLKSYFHTSIVGRLLNPKSLKLTTTDIVCSFDSDIHTNGVVTMSLMVFIRRFNWFYNKEYNNTSYNAIDVDNVRMYSPKLYTNKCQR